jgi:GntR family transcriptional repressor for pyruvate dehydrogenase complex
MNESDVRGFGKQVERSTRLSDKVADAMLNTILQRGLRPGDALPSERELGEQYGVSRTVVREAVRALTSRGVIDARAGRGLTVAQVAAEAVSMSMQLYLHGQEQIPYPKIHEVRATIETQIAGYAAERGTDAEIAELRELTESMRRHEHDREKHSEIDVEFHRALARMTHNELYLIMLDSIGPVLLEIRRATFSLPNDGEKAYEEHNRIIDAVARRDPEAAREAMRAHLGNAERDWSKLGNVRLRGDLGR